MQSHFCSTASARAQGEDALPSLSGTASKIVKLISQVMISDIREEVKDVLELAREDVIELLTNNNGP